MRETIAAAHQFTANSTAAFVFYQPPIANGQPPLCATIRAAAATK
jgi:hypothetical protein